MMGRSKELPSARATPQAISWVLNEIRKKEATLPGRTVFLFLHTNDFAAVAPPGEAAVPFILKESSLLRGHHELSGTSRTDSSIDHQDSKIFYHS